MKRNLQHISDNVFDLLIIGGGISGACTCWDATLRGLSVALLEKGDFGEATSSASSKLIHGGIRYLQQGNIFLLRESLKNRKIFMKIAPHLTYPLPFLIPTYGHLIKGKEILALAMMLYDLVGFNRNKDMDPSKHIPGFTIVSKEEILNLEPAIPTKRLTGGILYNECHMHNSERMTLSFILSAAEKGAAVANYLEAVDFLLEENRVIGIKAKDNLTGELFDIRAKLVVNISGPWAFNVLGLLPDCQQRHSMCLAKGIHLVARKLTKNHALALAIRQQRVSLLDRGGRHIFFIPWRGYSLIGTSNVHHRAPPDELKVTQRDVLDFIAEINQAFPAANLGPEDIKYSFGGLYPLVDTDLKKEVYQYTAKNEIYDHKKKDGIEGLVSVIGAKYTTAITLAKKVTDLCFRKLGRKPIKCATDVVHLYGGNIEHLEGFVKQAKQNKLDTLDFEVLQNLIHNYGSNYSKILAYSEENPEWGGGFSGSRSTIKAQIINAVREEMAQTLSDVIFRRTGLGTVGNPGKDCIDMSAQLMGTELGWNGERVKKEISEVTSHFTIKD